MKEHRNLRSFWQRPEGITGGLVIVSLLVILGFLIIYSGSLLTQLLTTPIGLTFFLIFLGLVLYVILDTRMRDMIWYFYKNSMRWITGLFVKIDPIRILSSYVEDLNDNIRKMRRQMGQLRGQMHQLREIIYNNEKQIQEEIVLADEARRQNKENVLLLKTRKVARLRDSTDRLEDLYNRMEVLYQVLEKMYENSEILLEDVRDQVYLKEQEREAIMAGRTAMESAMSVINGDEDRKEIFDEALEVVADDVSHKVGEMEEFITMSENFMNSIDLRSGIFREKGLKMLEKWEKNPDALLPDGDEGDILDELKNKKSGEKSSVEEKDRDVLRRNQYDSFFD